jgi:hypothetical protein
MRSLLRIAAVCLIAGLFTSSAYAQERISDNFYQENNKGALEIEPNNSMSLFGKNDFRNDQIMDVDFLILDSLQNAYSYFSDRQQPFIYNKNYERLITIHRGALPRTASGDDILDNLFFRTSEDWGKSWTEKTMIYDSRSSTADGMARYPSVYAFEYEEQMTLVYTSPVTDGTGWKGFINGIYLPDLGELYLVEGSFQHDGRTFEWGTDAKILGGVESNNPFGIAIGGVMPPEGERDVNSNSNLAYRRSNANFDAWPVTIPDAWASSNFSSLDPSSLDSRTSVIISLKYGPDGNMYKGAFGGFVDSDVENRATLGLSVSEDLGKTWSEFDVVPFSTIQNYGIARGVPADSMYIPYNSKDMVVHENGDASFVCTIYQISDTSLVPYDEQMHDIIEVYREGGVWGVRKIGELTGYTLAYLPTSSGDPANNQMDVELQLSETVDGSKMICKWVDFVDVEQDGEIIKNATNDIFIATKRVDDNEWGDPANITESLSYDRITWIPNYVPDDMADIPLLKLASKPVATDDPTEARNRQRQLEEPQYILMGHFNAVVGVEDDPETSASLVINSIVPNPAPGIAELSFTLPRGGNSSIAIFDALGNRIINLHEGYLSAGLHGININTSQLANGAYYVVVRSGNESVTEVLTVAK